VCDTPKAIGEKARKTVSDHIDEVVNIMAILGADRKKMSNVEDLEAVAEVLQQQQPYFQIRTWKGSKQEIVTEGGKVFVVSGKQCRGPYKDEAAAKAANKYIGSPAMVNETWGTVLPDYVPEDGHDEQVDETGEVADEPVADEGVAEGEVEGEAEVATEGEAEVAEGEAEVAEEGTTEVADEWGELAEAADGGDAKACKTMASEAKKAGVPDKDVKESSSWAEVADMIRNASGGEGEVSEVAEEAPWEPSVEQSIKFKPLDKNKKPVKKAIDAEITEVNSDKKTVTLKNLDDGKTVYKNVAWDRLIHE
jgi:hypothetical protein